MKLNQELCIFLFYLCLLTISELIVSYVDVTVGLFIDSLMFVSLISLSAFRNKTADASNILLCLSIAPLIRIFSLSLPLTYFPTYAWYIISAIPMTIAAIILMRLQRLNLNDVGLNKRKPFLQFAIMFTGVPFGVMEYLILKPASIIDEFSVASVVLIALALMFSTGFVEELIFRGIFQVNAVKMFGPKIGLLVVSAIFAALHIGWLNVFDVVLVFLIGLFFAIIMFKTGSLIGVSLSHGLTNVFLFVVLPSVNFISLMAPK